MMDLFLAGFETPFLRCHCAHESTLRCSLRTCLNPSLHGGHFLSANFFYEAKQFSSLVMNENILLWWPQPQVFRENLQNSRHATEVEVRRGILKSSVGNGNTIAHSFISGYPWYNPQIAQNEMRSLWNEWTFEIRLRSVCSWSRMHPVHVSTTTHFTEWFAAVVGFSWRANTSEVRELNSIAPLRANAIAMQVPKILRWLGRWH